MVRVARAFGAYMSGREPRQGPGSTWRDGLFEAYAPAGSESEQARTIRGSQGSRWAFRR